MAESASGGEGGWARRTGLAMAGVLGVALMLHFGLWRCPVAALFSVPCPGCGLTRAALALLALDVPRAIELQPLSPVVVPWAAIAGIDALLRFVRGSPAPGRFAVGGPLAGLLAAALISVWVSRFFGVFGGPVQVGADLLG